MLGIGEKRTNGHSESSQNKQLQRLNRQDLLELLVGQIREADELRETVKDKDRDIQDDKMLVKRLKEKLDLKDDQIAHLKERLDLKDDQIGRFKAKLNDKDVQIEHLKGKLDEKDEIIERLKSRLDSKDALISRLSGTADIDPDLLAIYDSRERAAESVLRKERDE